MKGAAQKEMFKHEYLKLCEKYGLCLEPWLDRGEMFVGRFTDEHRQKINSKLRCEEDRRG